MCYADFRKLYEELQSIPSDAKPIENKYNKPEMSNMLSSALKALKLADSLLIMDLDKVINTAKAIVDRNTQPLCTQIMNKTPPIVMVPIDSSRNQSADSDVKAKISSTLKNIKVDKCHMTQSGTVFIDFPTYF